MYHSQFEKSVIKIIYNKQLLLSVSDVIGYGKKKFYQKSIKMVI